MFTVSGRPGDTLVIKQFVGITRTIIISTQHFSCEGFSKTPGSADTGQLLNRSDAAVDQLDQPRLVNVFRLSDFREPAVSGIHILSMEHGRPSLT